MLTADHLGAVADHLIGHFVDRARRSGTSWTDGIDPQQGFGRFTPQARNVVVTSRNEPCTAGNGLIGPVHLVLGLLAEHVGLGAHAIVAQGHYPRGGARRGHRGVVGGRGADASVTETPASALPDADTP